MQASKYKYILRSAFKTFSRYQCPSCGNKKGTIIDRKWFFTSLIECSNCFLLSRFPKDKHSFNKNFYQEEYIQDDGITTDLPDKNLLDNWMENNFKDSGKEADYKIEIIKSLNINNKQISIIDYGASWGYESFQFKMAGMKVNSFEISKPRAKFGKNLGLDICYDIDDLPENNDFFYSSHVIEHLPDVSEIFKIASKKLTIDGIMITFCPNGCNDFRNKNPKGFHMSWGLVHPNLLNEKYFKNQLQDIPYYIGTSPYRLDNIKKWVINKNQFIDDLSGNELLVIAQINKNRA